MTFYTLSDEINAEFINIEYYINKIKMELSKKSACSCPVVIDYKKENLLLLFFFKSGLLKTCLIYDKKNCKKYKTNFNSNIMGICLYDNDIYAKDTENNLLKLGQKKQEV